MRTYDIFTKDGQSVAVKSGFSWVGFFFVWIWALIKKLWVAAIIGLVLILLINLIAYTVAHLLFGATSYMSMLQVPPAPGSAAFHATRGLTAIILMLVFGLKGNVWVCKSLLKKGFTKSKTVQAKNKQKALSDTRA